MAINKTTKYTTNPNTIPVDSSTGTQQGLSLALDDRVNSSSGDISNTSVSTDTGSSQNTSAAFDERVSYTRFNDFPTSSHPGFPTISDHPKIVMTTSGVPYIVTRKAHGKPGYVAMTLGNEVSPADANNIGGASNWRLQQVENVNRAYVAKTEVYSQSAGVTESSVSQSFKDSVWGYSESGSVDIRYAEASALPVSLSNRGLYEIPNGENIVYSSDAEEAVIRFGMSSGSTPSCKIEVSTDAVAWNIVDDIDLSLSASGSGRRDYRLTSPDDPGLTWFVRITNTGGAGPTIYVAGLNISLLNRASISRQYDNALFMREADISSTTNLYLSGGGANEFAARELGGKFFGTYHGGHSGAVERLRTDTDSVDPASAPAIEVTGGVQLYSKSDLAGGETASVYEFTSFTTLGDGASNTAYSLELKSGDPVACEIVYTHMATTSRTFESINIPKSVFKTDDGEVTLGKTGVIQQSRGADVSTINAYFTQVDIGENGFGGARVSFQTSYNKQYYGPAVSSVSGYDLESATYVTCKEFF